MPLYNPGPTAVDQHAMGSQNYDGGTSWSGEIYQDGVQFETGPDVRVDFVAITDSEGFFQNETPSNQYQGILGLGPNAGLVAGTTSYIEAALQTKTEKQFAFQLCPDNGTMWIGGVDSNAEESAPVFTDMAPSLSEYAVSVNNMAVGSASPAGSASDFGVVIVDTGTAFTYVPSDVIDTLISEIQTSAGFKSSFSGQSLAGCLKTDLTSIAIDAALPPLHVAFAGSNGSDTPYADLPATTSYLVFAGSDVGGGGVNDWCLGFKPAMTTTASGENISVFGATILGAFVTVFDLQAQQVGFAPQTGCAAADTAEPRYASSTTRQFAMRLPGPSETSR
jgi:hypothetical protein